MDKPITHDIPWGTEISDGCRQMFVKSELFGGIEVVSEFNGIPLSTKGFANWEAMADDWWDKSNERQRELADSQAREEVLLKHRSECFTDLLAACIRAKEILDSWGPERWGDTLQRLHERLDKAIKKATVTP